MFVPYGASTPKFAVDIGITALKTFFAQIYTVLGAHVAGFSIWMIYALSHFFPSGTFGVLNLAKVLTRSS
jgi:hypothetical protein